MNSKRNTVRSAAIFVALVLCAHATSANAQDHRRGTAGIVERQPEPRGYARFEQPLRTQERPQAPDLALFHHNYSASRNYHIGPYRAPPGFRYRRIGHGDILPPVFWGSQYRLADYWLFGLDVPPVGYEWVRYGPDALLVDMATGEVVAAVYDDFL